MTRPGASRPLSTPQVLDKPEFRGLAGVNPTLQGIRNGGVSFRQEKEGKFFDPFSEKRRITVQDSFATICHGAPSKKHYLNSK